MGENGPRPWEVSVQAADNVDVITQELTGRDLMDKNPGIMKCTHEK